MKKINLIFLSLLITILHNGRLYSQEGCLFSNDIQNSNGRSGLANSINGWAVSPSGEFRVLVVFAEVVDPNGQADNNTQWPAHQYPTWADNWIANSINGLPQEYFSRLFYQNSLGNLKVTGDYLVNPNNESQIIQVSNVGSIYSNVINYINANYSSFKTKSGITSPSNFDMWNLDNKLEYEQANNNQNSKLDHLMVIVKGLGNTNGNNTGWADTGNTYINSLGCTFESISFFRGDNAPPLTISQHEISHFFIGDNRWHTSGDGFQNPFWTMHGGAGWGLLGLYGSTFQMATGYDRYRLGWSGTGRNTQQIYARNATNTSDINGELDYYNLSHQGDYILRDFLTTGDALRIKLPYLDNGEAPQYLWIENHQTNINNGGVMDDYFWRNWNFGETPNSCIEAPMPGLYSYIQLGEDRINNGFTSQYSQYFCQLSAEGSYDYNFIDISPLYCIGAANKKFERFKQNPFSGLPDLYYHPWDNSTTTPSTIGFKERINLGQDAIDNSVREPKNGDARDAFRLSGNSKISVFSNPSSAPIITSISSPGTGTPVFTGYTAPNNRIIYLNGLSITITDETNGNIKVNVRFDDRAITGGNLRWAGDKILLKRTANTITPSNGNMLTLSNTTLTVDRSLTNNRYNNPQVVNNRKLFNNTTVFSVEGLSTHQCVFEANTNSTITIDEGSKLEVKQYGTLRLTNSTLYVKNNSILEIQANGLLELNGTAKIVVESGGKLLYNGGTVKLNNNTSIIEIKDGYLEIAANKTFTYSGSSASVYGYLKFASPNAVSDNIIANTGSIIDFTGFSKFKTVFEVTQETMYLPANLAQFKLKNASVLMGPGARVQVNGGNTIVNIDNCRFGSTTGAKTTHRGFVLFGQPNVTVQASTFENGNYGLYDWLTYNGAAHTFTNCTFHNNNIGLFTHDKGITLNTCSFIKNSQYGWYAEAMSFHSYANSSTFGGSAASANGTGLYFQGAYNISLKVDNPSISYNTNGAIIDGTVAYFRCGFVKNNSGNGIEVKNYATLEMGDNWPGYNLPSKVEATNNGITIKCTNAYNIDLINGQNALWASVQGQQKVVNGTLDRGCTGFNINVNSNQWKSAGGALTSTDYLLNTVDVDVPCGTYPVTLTDPTPITYANCGGGGGGGQSAMMSSSSTLTTSSPSANTTLNAKETQLNDASQYLTSFGGNDDYKSLIKLRKYLNDNYTKYSTMDEINMLNRAYYLALESYTNIIQSGANNTQLLSAKNIVDDVHQKMETISSNRKNINKFNLGLNKANIVRTKSNYTDALTELGNNTVNASNSNLTILENWQCIVQTEQVQLSTQTSNTYTPIDASTGCYISTNRMMHSTSLNNEVQEVASEQKQSLFTQSNTVNSYFNFNLSPNPNNGLFTIDIESENETLCEIVVIDVTGKEIHKDVCRVSAGINSKRLDDKLEKGIYFVNIRTELGDNKTMRVIVN